MARPVKILAVSDRVLDGLYHSQVHNQLPDIDLIISCGDLPLYYLDFLTSALDAPLLFVRGNHDSGRQHTADGRVLTEVRGGTNIHGRVVARQGLIIAGLEGSMRYRPGAPYMYSESEMRLQIAQLTPRLLWNRRRFGRALDILVTHSPPYGIHDKPDLPHTGFKALLSFLKIFKPRYHLHGHIHIYRQDTTRVTQYGSTSVINVYPRYLLDVEPLGGKT